MGNNNARLNILLALLVLLVWSEELEALQVAETGLAEPAKSEASAEDPTGGEGLATERSTDLREAIIENLDTSRETDEPSKPVSESGDEALDEAELSGAGEEEHWYSKFESVTEFVRTAPDYVPGLAGKGWLHFGRVEVEYGHFSEGVLEDDSGFNLRSLRGGIIRKFNERLTVKLELDATDGDSNWADLYGRFSTKLGLITVGNQKIAQTLVNQTSRLSRTFMEEPLPADAFGLGRRLGVGWDFHRNKIGAHLTVFGKDLNEQIGKFGYGIRLYTNPTKTRFSMFHLGLSAVREKMDHDARFGAYPESRVTDTRLVDTGQNSDIDQQSIFGVELAGARGSYSVRSEYFIADWDRKTGDDPRFQGFYVQANWAITGEAFQYTQGKFLRIRPISHRGAWEVAIRYSHVDLNDMDVLGGEQRNASLALNWYGPGNQLRVMINLIYVETDAVAGDQSPLIAQVRVQVHW